VQVRNTHILLVDYRPNLLDLFARLFDAQGAITHRCVDRMDAIGKLWELIDKGIHPRALLTNWVLDDPEARKFYHLIGREVDHTSLGLLRNATIMDPEGHTVLVCYTDDPTEAIPNLSAERLIDKVALVNSHQHRPEEIVKILLRDERTRILNYFQEEAKTDSYRKAMSKRTLSGVTQGRSA